MNNISKECHMGRLIESKFLDQDISVAKFADMINTSRQNVYHIFKRKRIKSEQLKLISSALNCDFSQYIPKHFKPEVFEEPRIKITINIDTCDSHIEGLIDKLCRQIEDLNNLACIETSIERN